MSRLLKVLIVIVLFSGTGGLVAASYYFAPIIEADQRGVVMTGKSDPAQNLKILAPGKHYWFISGYNPISNILVRVSIREQELSLHDSDSEPTLSLTTQNGDLVQAEFALWYRVKAEQAGLLLAALGENDIEKVITEIATATVREQAAYYDSDAFYQGQIQREYLAKAGQNINHELAAKGLEVTTFKIKRLLFSNELLQKIEEIKKARATIEVNKIKAQAAEVAAKGRKQVALQEAQARKESVILASEAQLIAARNWVEAEKVKTEIMLVRSQAKAKAMQIEAQAKVFSGPDGERFLRYRIADSLADAWMQNNSQSNASEASLDAITSGITSLSCPVADADEVSK
ncbi:MAG TPA: hypothetical protein ENN66_03430 [Proteobacteria bacterium]|nr:hypothetical protein [Pseudomonadota bacterium]